MRDVQFAYRASPKYRKICTRCGSETRRGGAFCGGGPADKDKLSSLNFPPRCPAPKRAIFGLCLCTFSPSSSTSSSCQQQPYHSPTLVLAISHHLLDDLYPPFVSVPKPPLPSTVDSVPSCRVVEHQDSQTSQGAATRVPVAFAHDHSAQVAHFTTGPYEAATKRSIVSELSSTERRRLSPPPFSRGRRQRSLSPGARRLGRSCQPSRPTLMGLESS